MRLKNARTRPWSTSLPAIDDLSRYSSPPIGPPSVGLLSRAFLLLLRSVVSTSGIAKGERRDRRTAVIIKQKTTVDSDNKEEIRAPMRPRGSERTPGRVPFAGEGIETESREREARYSRRRGQRARRMWFHAPRST